MYTQIANVPACTIAMESCAGAHWRVRKFPVCGYEVRLIALQFVEAFVKGNKTDSAGAEAICEAAPRPSMRFVTVKAPEQQTLRRGRERTATGNQIYAFLP